MKITGWQSTVKDSLSGHGLEIGALFSPFPINEETQMTYVDYMPTEQLKKGYPNDPIVTIDVVTKADNLKMFESNTFDFVCSSHVFEHLVNPLRALHEWIRVTKNGGHIYMVVPDMRETFDKPRNLTTVEHIKRDYIDKVDKISLEHYHDFYGHVAGRRIGEALDFYNRQTELHCHTFTDESLKQLLQNFNIIDFKKEGMNICALLQKEEL